MKKIHWIGAGGIVLLSGILLVTGVFAQERERGRRGMSMEDDAPKRGDVAPDFTLKTADGKGEVALASFRGKRPVVLIFGSYT
jgi:hypothetical protein